MIEIFKALSDETRLRILSLLLNEEMCVCEIEFALKLSQSNASKHLSILKILRILDSYKKAQWTYYRISEDFINMHKELWEYLTKQFEKLPSYENDLLEFENCRKRNMCCK